MIINKFSIPYGENMYATLVDPTEEEKEELKADGYFFWRRYIKEEDDKPGQFFWEELWIKPIIKTGYAGQAVLKWPFSQN